MLSGLRAGELSLILPAFLLLKPPLRMHKSGLIALAETYGLDRAELQQLKSVAEGFFDALRIELTAGTGAPIKLHGLTHSISTFKDIVATTAPDRCVFLGTPRQVAALISTDAGFARALVDMLISGRMLPDPGNRALTSIEQRLFSNAMSNASLRAVERVIATRTGIGNLRRIVPTLASGLADPAERWGLARITYEVAGASGEWMIGLPPLHFSIPKPAAAPTLAREPISAEEKARVRLADASAELVAVLGHAMLPLDAVRALRRGSILSLQPLKDGLPNVELRCGSEVLFTGAVVEHRGWRRFLIQHRGVSDERADQRVFDA